jgi:hypothetical protein
MRLIGSFELFWRLKGPELCATGLMNVRKLMIDDVKSGKGQNERKGKRAA